MSKKTVAFEEFIIDDSMFNDTSTKGSQTKFLSNDSDAESIMLSVPRGSSEKSVAESVAVQPTKYGQPLFDTVSISDDDDLSASSNFQEESIDAAVSEVSKATFPEVSIDNVPPELSKAAFPEESIHIETMSQNKKPGDFADIKEEPLGCEKKLFMASCPIENNSGFDDIKEEPLGCGKNLFMASCPSETPDFDDVSLSTIQLEDYTPVPKTGGMIVNSSSKILNLVPSPMEHIIEQTDSSVNKSVNFFLKMEKIDDHISINSVSVSKEDDKPIDLKETSISFDGKKGNISVNKNGILSQKEIKTDSFSDFISKIYEPLVGRNNSISDSTLDSGESTDEEIDAN